MKAEVALVCECEQLLRYFGISYQLNLFFRVLILIIPYYYYYFDDPPSGAFQFQG